MMNSFNLTLSGKHFICPSILNDSFAGQSHLGCRSLPFHDLEYFFPAPCCLQDFFWEISWTPLEVTASFPLSAFKILSLSLILGNIIMMCLGVFLLGSNFFGTLWASWTSWKFVSFARLGKFYFIICSNKFSISCSSSSPSGTPMIWMLERFEMSWRFLSLSSLF